MINFNMSKGRFGATWSTGDKVNMIQKQLVGRNFGLCNNIVNSGRECRVFEICGTME